MPLNLHVQCGDKLVVFPHVFWIVADSILPNHAGLIGSDLIAKYDWIPRLSKSLVFIQGHEVPLLKRGSRMSWSPALSQQAAHGSESRREAPTSSHSAASQSASDAQGCSGRVRNTGAIHSGTEEQSSSSPRFEDSTQGKLDLSEKMLLQQQVKLQPGASHVVSVGSNLLPYQSLSHFVPSNLHSNQIQLSFIKETADMHGQALMEVTNYGEETVELHMNAILAESEIDSEEEKNMLAYFEKLDSPTKSEDFDSHFDLDHLDPEVKEVVLALLREFMDVFLLSDDAIPATPLLKFSVQVDPNVAPIVRAPYRVARANEQLHDAEIQRMIKNEALEEATPTTRWFSPVVLVVTGSGATKKARGCIDIRALNQHCLQDHWPLPRPSDILHQIGRGQLLSSFDAACAFWGVEIEESSRDYFGVITEKGAYRCKRMPFGHKNSASVYCKLMAKILSFITDPETRRAIQSYIDDVYIHTDDLSSHLRAMRSFFLAMREARVKLKPQKAKILVPKLKILGHIVDSDGATPCNDKIRAVENFPRPATVTHVQRFLGMTGFYRIYVKHYAQLSAGLVELLRKDVDFHWSQPQEQSFTALKQALTSHPVMMHPDYSLPWIIESDASIQGLGGTLVQHHTGDGDHPVLYFSRLLTKAEKNYHAYELEFLAVYCMFKHCKYLITGSHVIVRTDCQALVYLSNCKKFEKVRMFRWSLYISSFDFEVVYRPGKQNAVADALSRAVPNESTEPQQESQVSPENVLLPVAVVTISEHNELQPVYDAGRFKREQRQDPVFGPIIQQLEQGQPNDTYSMADGLLYKQWKTQKNADRLVVPTTMTDKLIQDFHCLPWGAAVGSARGDGPRDPQSAGEVLVYGYCFSCAPLI